MAIADLKKDYVVGNQRNFGGVLGKSTPAKEDSSFLGNLTYIGGNTAAGLGGVFEGIGRLASSGVAKLAGDDRLARYYAKKSYIGEWQADMAERYSPGKVTQFFADAGAGVGQSSVFLLNLVAPGAGTVIFGTGIFGNSVGEAVNKTGQLGFKEYAYGGLSAGGELLMEKISGATFKAVGRIGAGVTGSLTKNAVETTATQTAKKGFLKAVASNAVLKDLLKESSGEFIEEFLGDFWDVGISRLTGVDPEASTTLGQAVYSGMVGFASGGLMSGSSMIINRAAAASRGYHINESGNAQQMVRTAEVVLEEAKTAENFQDPAGVVDMLKESVANYNAQKDKTNFASRVALGQMQMFTAYIEKNIGVMQAYTNIMKADAQTLEKYAQLASYYTNEKVTTRDLLNNRDNITTQMAIRDWVNGVLTVDSDLVAEAEVRDFTSTMEGGNATEGAGETRFSMTGDAAKQALKNQLDRNATAAQEAQQTAQATEITQTAFDDSKRVQNVRVADNMYLSIKKNSDGTYNYAINDKSAKQDANGGVWDKTNVPAEEMRQYYEQAKESAAQYEAQKAAQTTQETRAGTDGKTTAEGENAAQGQESTEEKAKEKPRQKSEIDSATEKKLNKMIKGFNAMAYRDRVAVSRMVKSAEANGVNAKTVKKIAIAMTARSGLDIRFTKSISQNGTWTVFKDGSQRRLILLNPDIQSPLEQTFLHEFMHDMMHDQYTNMKAVMDVTSGMLEKGAFDNYVRERRDEYFDACAKAGREGLILTKNEDGTVIRSFASEKAEKAFDLMMREEATANFGAEFLYRRGFLTRIARSNQKLVLRTFRAIGRWINDVRSRDMGTARSLEGYLRTIEDAVRNSKGNSEITSLLFGSNPAAQTAETKSAAEESETRYSIQDGKVVVDTDQHIFDGVERKDYGRIVRAYMREHFRGKEIAGAMFNKTSEKEYTSSEYTKRLLRKKQGTYDAKMRVSTELDNMLRVSEYIRHEDAQHPHEYNGKGYDRYSVKFEIGGENFSGELLVAIGDNDRRIFYDIVKIKRTDSPVSEATARKSDGKSARGTIGSEVGEMHTVQNRNIDASTIDSIHQKSENVKGKSKIGENTRFELPNTIENDVLKRYGKTYNWKETGYILRDGNRLDLSGRNEGASGGYRQVDHRDIFYEDSGDSGTSAMIDFMRRGNIRVIPESPGINLQLEPTESQYEKIADLVSRLGFKEKYFTVDFDDANGNTVHSLEYDGNVSYRKVISDIRSYFANGKSNTSDLMKFHDSTRFELSSGTGYSRGQMSKIVANRTKGKVYSQTDAAIAIDNVTALVSEILSDDNASLRAKIRGKSRAEVINILWERMNVEQGETKRSTALKIADYIINNVVVQEELDSAGKIEYARMVDVVNDIVEQFFNETSRKIKTETDMRVIGSTNVLEDYYFPILRDRKQRGSNIGDMRKAMMNTLETVNNISANQNRIEHADGRLDVYDVTAVIERHAVAMATYANLYEPIQSFDRVLNARVGQKDANGKLIRKTENTIGEIMERLYPGFRDSFTKLFGDIQGVKASREGVWDTVGKGIEKAQGLYASAVVSGNIKTVMLPPMSMFAAGSLIDMKYISRSLTMNNTKETRKASYEEMEKYSSVIRGRYYDRGAIKARTVQDSVRGLISVTGKGIEITEKFMINKLWSACKLQTSEQLGLAFDSDENCRAAAKLFDKVVTETQSQYVPSMKSSLARHNNVIVRGFTQFKSDGQAMLGSLYDNIRGYFDLKERKKAGQNVDAELKAAKKRAERSIPCIAAVCVGVAIITQGMRYLFNNDDEDDETPVKNIAMNTLNSAMGMFPLVGDVYSVFAEGYDISNMTLDALNDGVNGIKAMTSLIGNDNATQADVARATRKALYGVGHMAGVPVRNLTNLTTGVIRRISKPAMYGYDSIFSGEKYSEDLKKAVKRGDDKMAEAITKVMFRRKKTGAYNQETLDEVLRLYKAGYDKKVMPGGIPDGLTRAQRKTFLNVYGKSDADVQKLIESDAYKAFDDDQKASAISSLYRSWRAYAEYQATGETDDKSALLSEIMGADKFGKARAYLSGLKAKENAEAPKDGWRSTIQKGLKGMGLTSDEQALMLYAAGYHSTSDLSAFLRVLNAKNLTKEQLALFAEIFKLDVKNGKLVERKSTKKTA